MPLPLLSDGSQEYVETGSDLGNQIEDLKRQFAGFTLETLKQVTDLKSRISRIEHGMAIACGDSPVAISDSSNKWEAIKTRLPPRLREAVDILLLQGSMKRTQLASALKMDYSNCTKNVVTVLKAQGWLIEQNGELSLKPL